MSVSNQYHRVESELQYTTTNEHQQGTVPEVAVQQHPLKTISTWIHAVSKTKIKFMCAGLLLLFIVSVGIIALHYHRATLVTDANIVREQDETKMVHDWESGEKTDIDNEMSEMKTSQQLEKLDDEDNVENNNEKLPQLRSYVHRDRSSSSKSTGYMNTYIRSKGRRDGGRRSYQRFRFPVARYSRRDMPFKGPFLSFMPWTPIVADRSTKQTIIYSKTEVYVIPPLINTYGDSYSIAELIASKDASLYRNGGPLVDPIHMNRFFQRQSLTGPNIPMINSRHGGFKGGVRTNLGSFSISKPYETRSNIDSTYESEEKEDRKESSEEQEQEQENKYRPASNVNNYYYKRPRKPVHRPNEPSKIKPQPSTTKCQKRVLKGSPPHPWKKFSSEPSHSNESITFYLIIKQDPIARKKFESLFWKITNPDSNQYQQWLTRSQINAILKTNTEALNAIKRWIAKESLISVNFIGDDTIQIKTTVEQASKHFSTEFHPYQNSNTGRTIHRTFDDICLPDEINEHVEFHLGLNDFRVIHKKPTKSYETIRSASVDASTSDTTTIVATTAAIVTKPYIIPQFVKKYYNIPEVQKNDPSSVISQGSLQFLGQYYREQDLLLYAKLLELPIKSLKKNHIRGSNNQSNPGLETMLDVEQMSGLNPSAETWYFNYDKSFNDSGFGENFFSIALLLNQLDDIPQVMSVSYTEPEIGICSVVSDCDNKIMIASQKYIDRTNLEFMKLGMRGITILVSSGDDGANGLGGNNETVNCTNKVFYPGYPGTSSFITSVGGTELMNMMYETLPYQPSVCLNKTAPVSCVSDGDEVAAGMDYGYTSGGGFSTVMVQPSYQKDVVNRYFQESQCLNSEFPKEYPPSSMYNQYGRAFPDVAALGVYSFTVWNGVFRKVGGTSMSAPMWAGIVSILNSYSINMTNRTLGFLNPLLYKMAKDCPKCFKDITSGDNICVRDTCNDQCKGFQASCGWDPVTGLGTPNVGKMLKYIKKLLKKKMKETNGYHEE
ncbi:unnamed protein product [Adineta steineri]|uniref:Tripeptidyl-peptidase 1 n=1 Tax=Adineta steineri TaxID=433720 RepID=A0A814IIP6_9BILA|nr:unnamed protein product [Adineta steineri]CAF1575235.1 unnamed protein product [Adineta steineri]